MLYTFATAEQAEHYETSGGAHGDTWNSGARSSGFHVRRAARVLYDFPAFEVDNPDGFLLTCHVNKNTTFGFKDFYYVLDARGREYQASPRAQWLRGETARRLGLSGAFRDGTPGALESFRRGEIERLCTGRDDLPSEAEIARSKAHLERFAVLMAHVKVVRRNQWGPSPNEAYPEYSHDLARLWKTLDLDASALAPTKSRVEIWIDTPAMFRAYLSQRPELRARIIAVVVHGDHPAGRPDGNRQYPGDIRHCQDELRAARAIVRTHGAAALTSDY